MIEEMVVNEEDIVRMSNLHKEAMSYWISSKLEHYQLKKTWYQEDGELQLEYFKKKHATKLKLMKKKHAYQLKMAQRKKHELKLKHMAERHYMILDHVQYLKIHEKKHELWEEYMEKKLKILTDLADIMAKLKSK